MMYLWYNKDTNKSSLTGKPEDKLMILFELLICPLFVLSSQKSVQLFKKYATVF